METIEEHIQEVGNLLHGEKHWQDLLDEYESLLMAEFEEFAGNEEDDR